MGDMAIASDNWWVEQKQPTVDPAGSKPEDEHKELESTASGTTKPAQANTESMKYSQYGAKQAENLSDNAFKAEMEKRFPGGTDKINEQYKDFDKQIKDGKLQITSRYSGEKFQLNGKSWEKLQPKVVPPAMQQKEGVQTNDSPTKLSDDEFKNSMEEKFNAGTDNLKEGYKDFDKFQDKDGNLLIKNKETNSVYKLAKNKDGNQDWTKVDSSIIPSEEAKVAENEQEESTKTELEKTTEVENAAAEASTEHALTSLLANPVVSSLFGNLVENGSKVIENQIKEFADKALLDGNPKAAVDKVIEGLEMKVQASTGAEKAAAERNLEGMREIIRPSLSQPFSDQAEIRAEMEKLDKVYSDSVGARLKEAASTGQINGKPISKELAEYHYNSYKLISQVRDESGPYRTTDGQVTDIAWDTLSSLQHRGYESELTDLLAR